MLMRRVVARPANPARVYVERPEVLAYNTVDRGNYMIYQKILLPVSGKHGGGRALKALNHALKMVNGEIVVMHAFDTLPKLVGGEAHAELLREAQAKAMTLLSPVVNAVQEAGMPCRTRVVEGSPAESIIHVAHEEQCDLIVMFTDGCDEISDMLLGTVTERVLRSSDVPLLAIRR